ncbi:MAG: peptidase S1, partial [Hydrogenophaga sp.]|nr:peptidase S1 [Hydrogenophaga sp.]
MRKPALYSPSHRAGSSQTDAGAAQTQAAAAEPTPVPAGRVRRFRQASARAAASPRVMWSAMVLLAALLAASVWQAGVMGPKALTQKDIDAAVLRTLTTQNLPSRAARAAEKIRPAVVRVVSYAKN